ncbi:MAG: hypothetical protein K5869_07675 [Saccharofermentans sp.]|nr:hypothetical protein [Saccharofermentans sp.]
MKYKIISRKKAFERLFGLQLEKKERLGYIGIGGMFVVNSAGDYIFIKALKMGMFGLGLSSGFPLSRR